VPTTADRELAAALYVEAVEGSQVEALAAIADALAAAYRRGWIERGKADEGTCSVPGHGW
jgi:hypothetical protein